MQELINLEQQVMALANELVSLSSDDNIFTLDDGCFKALYVGRGTEQIQLTLSSKYALSNRIFYAKGNIQRLEALKRDCLEGV